MKKDFRTTSNTGSTSKTPKKRENRRKRRRWIGTSKKRTKGFAMFARDKNKLKRNKKNAT